MKKLIRFILAVMVAPMMVIGAFIIYSVVAMFVWLFVDKPDWHRFWYNENLLLDFLNSNWLRFK